MNQNTIEQKDIKPSQRVPYFEQFNKSISLISKFSRKIKQSSSILYIYYLYLQHYLFYSTHRSLLQNI
ncbi:unnamed protein product [Paramecium sonneborni]|uniref:Uncharacterized protein n=1 Tax=Paramecium sonneborni TaxID=65129 RepID=A0A8S1Q6M6_9CILI|nr:unnamed protein product [Paramecium sonneborni]